MDLDLAARLQDPKLRTLCRDEAAFGQLQKLLSENISPLTQQLQQARFQIERYQALFHVITRLREPLDLEHIFRTTATEVRRLLAADRVGMFRFEPGSGCVDGEFVSEDVDVAFPSALAQPVRDRCFGDQFAPHYNVGRMQVVPDIHRAGLSDCHVEILERFQVRANLVVPLLQGEHLWGLLCIHQCDGPREWEALEVEFVAQIAHHLGVALLQAELLVDLRLEVAERQQAELRAQGFNQSLRQAVIDLKSVNHELEAFSSSVSHDLRAPLRSIDGFSQALLEDCGDTLDVSGKDYLRRIRAATQRMGQLIDDLLTLARVSRSDMHWATIDLSDLAHRLCQDLRQQHTSDEVQRLVEVRVQPGMRMRGDRNLLPVALENLLANAWKFTAYQERATIEVGSLPEENGLPTIYFVRDDGAGFEMAYVHKLFAPFQRLHSLAEFPGTGIGLATVQRIIHRHGGRVWAEGTVGQGATFYFTLAEGGDPE
jgi:light-regulated signal transduction histidine kinase (bacteriophytochrome)